ncbi:hemicentin-1 [Bicyclus anynana]|uniref:Hemicentin-1 n=1 Tax=Bicyclus anynana TaxID=110368 RepID=A0ABM3M0E4_BICAN|nr:hemicentin-1 [Bicyclus anynana]
MIIKKISVLIVFLVLLSNVSGEETKVSLTFVIDNTYSMNEDIEEVKRRTDDVFNAVLNSNISLIDEFIIVTFNDPKTGWNVESATLRVKTNRRDLFKEALHKIKVFGGDDCPEMSMTGIELGLNTSKPHSYLYVFTDADALDYKKYNYVKSLALEKSIQVTFLLTGQCETGIVEKQRYVYNNLATATSGQVFHIKKQEISKIIEYILVNLRNKRTTLLRKCFKNDAECGNKHSFTVDSKLWEIVIALSAPKPIVDDDINVTGPDGTPVEVQQLVSSQNTTIVKLKDEVGKYSISIPNCHDVTVLITASTSISFQYGFSSDKPHCLDETYRKPVQDIKSYLAIELDNKERDVTLKNVELWDIDDEFIVELPLKLIDSDRQLYITETKFSAPHQTFKIAVKGLTESKELITRVSPTTIEYERVTKKPAKVTILGAKKVFVKLDEPLELKCKVYGYPQPLVTWEDKYNNTMNSSISTIALGEYISTLHIDNVIESTIFTCKAKNFIIDADNVTVITKNKFIVIEYPKDVAVIYGKSVELSLKIDAIPPATINWYQGGKEIINIENIEIKTSSDNSVFKIKNAKPKLGGKYYVKVTNGEKNVEYEFNVVVTDAEIPKIDKNIRNYTKDKDSSVDIICRIIKGKPKPAISWSFDRNFQGKFSNLNETTQTIHINRVTQEKVGTYKCKAVNDLGNDTHSMELNVQYRPTVEVKPRRTYDAKNGTKVKLSCLVDGSPIPKVRWLVGDKEIKDDEKYKIYRDHALSFTGSIKDSGSYVCEASNSLGTERRNVTVEFYEPVKIDIPYKTTFDADLRSTLILSCRANGNPKPKVVWWRSPIVNNIPVTPIRVECDENNNVILENIQSNDEGQYFCRADNNYSSQTLTYTVNVPVPVSILKLLQNTIDVVEGDARFQLQCIVWGSPKPTVRWIYNGITITDGGSYEIKNDYTLVVKNVSSKSGGTYSCKAENTGGNDTIEYEVNVHPYPPRDDYATDTTYLLEGNGTHNIPCGTELSEGDLVRWFKDGHLLRTGELTLINVTKADVGHYICRISKSKYSYSYHKRILLGTEAKFVTGGNTIQITFEEGAEAQLDCSATGDPPPKTVWYRKIHRIEGITTSRYSILMNNNNIYNWKNIMCSVSNVFGTIKRYFEIVEEACLMSLEDDFTSRQPILTMGNNKRSWPVFPVSNGSLQMLKHRNFTFFCPDSYISYKNENYGDRMITYCVGDSMFYLEGKAVSASEITCNKSIVPLAKNFNRPCRGSDTTLMAVGFDVGGSFMPVYRVCFDNITKTPLYVEHDIHKSIANMTPKHKAEYTRSSYLTLEYEDIYDCRNQIDPISSYIGKSLKSDEKCCFKRRQLVNPKDVLPGVAQVATYHNLNVVPQWSSCGSENWDEVERRVRMYAINTNGTVKMWTGATSVKHEIPAIYLKDKLNQKLQVPQYIWRVVQGQLAVIHVNVPNLTLSTALSYILCEDICNTIPWMMYEHWRDLDKGFIYCCKLKDFEEAFDYYGYQCFK